MPWRPVPPDTDRDQRRTCSVLPSDPPGTLARLRSGSRNRPGCAKQRVQRGTPGPVLRELRTGRQFLRVGRDLDPCLSALRRRELLGLLEQRGWRVPEVRADPAGRVGGPASRHQPAEAADRALRDPSRGQPRRRWPAGHVAKGADRPPVAGRALGSPGPGARHHAATGRTGRTGRQSGTRRSPRRSTEGSGGGGPRGPLGLPRHRRGSSSLRSPSRSSEPRRCTPPRSPSLRRPGSPRRWVLSSCSFRPAAGHCAHPGRRHLRTETSDQAVARGPGPRGRAPGPQGWPSRRRPARAETRQRRCQPARRRLPGRRERRTRHRPRAGFPGRRRCRPLRGRTRLRRRYRRLRPRPRPRRRHLKSRRPRRPPRPTAEPTPDPTRGANHPADRRTDPGSDVGANHARRRAEPTPEPTSEPTAPTDRLHRR